MPDLIYNENRLLDELDKLSVPLRVLFAVTCAERSFPAYERYVAYSEEKVVHALKPLLEKLWLDLNGDAMSASEIDDAIENCSSVIDDINDSEFIGQAADDAASSLCYALRCRRTGEAQEAAWAAQRLYDTLDTFVTDQEDIDISRPEAQSRILAHPLIQAELRRQRRDLEELLQLGHENTSNIAIRFRERAKADAHLFFVEH